jgi:hypothetical protein
MDTRLCAAACFCILMTLGASRASAQAVEVSPVGGVRLGGDLFEVAAGRALDVDAAPVVGGTLNVDMGEGLSFEGIYTHQWTKEAGLRLTIDQWLAGGRQEYGIGRARPFLSGLLGLTRYASNGDGELRFTLAVGGGLKVAMQRHLALRLDSRVSTTFIDAEARAIACGTGTCLVVGNAALVWQIEFSGGVVIIF